MNSINMKATTNCSDHRKIFSERLNKLIDKAYGEKRGSKKQFYEDFSTVLENNNIGDGKSIDEAGKKWTTGQGMPKIETLELLAGFFNVSIDYLIGKTDIESSIDENFIREYIGLEPHATRLLREYYSKGYQWALNTIDVLNFLLERKETANILTNMYYYFFGNYTHTKNGEKTIPLMDENEHGVEFIVSDMQKPTFLSYVTIGLTDAYKNYVKDNEKYKDYGKPTKENYVLRCLDSYTGTRKEKLEKLKSDNEKEISLWENKLSIAKEKNVPELIEDYNEFLKNTLETKAIIENMIKSL